MKLLLSTLVLISSMQATMLSLNSGWNLVGSNKDNVEVNSTMPTAKSVWIYENNRWSVASPNGMYTTEQLTANYDTFSHINAGNGFWVNVSEDVNITLTGDEVTDKTIDVLPGWNLLSSKTTSNTDVKTYLSSPEIRLAWKYSPLGWEAYSQSRSISNSIMAYNIPVMKVLKVGEGFWVYSIEEVNMDAPCVQNENIASALDTINTMDPAQDSLTATLTNVKSTLDINNDNEKVLSAFIDIIEIVNSSEVQALMDQNTSLPNLDALGGDANVLVTLASNANALNGSNVMHLMAEKLKSASDTIGSAYTDTLNVICYVDNSGNSFNVNKDDALLIRSAALSAASALDLFASYSYGNLQTFFATKTADIGGVFYEYIEADVDPIAMMQQSTFFMMTDTARLAIAGSYLLQAADLMSSVDTTKVTIDTLVDSDLDGARKIKTAFAGDGIYLDDNITQESVNLIKLFSATEYLDRDDFIIPAEYLDYNNNGVTLDENATIINAKPMFTSSYFDGTSTQYWTAQASYNLEQASSFESVVVVDVQEKYFSGNTLYFVAENGSYATRNFASLNRGYGQWAGTHLDNNVSGGYAVYDDGINIYINNDSSNYEYVYKYFDSIGSIGKKYNLEVYENNWISDGYSSYNNRILISKVEVHTYTSLSDRDADAFYIGSVSSTQ